MARLFSILMLLAAVLSAADVSGKWTGQMPGRDGATAATFVFKVDGDKLTGTLTGPQGRFPCRTAKLPGTTFRSA